MKRIALDIFRNVSAFYNETFNRVTTIAEAARMENDPYELTDIALAMNEAHKKIKALEVKFRAIKEMAEKKACAQALTQANEDTFEDKIQTEWARATIDMKMIGRVPKRKDNPEAWEQLMTWLGVPESTYTPEDEEVGPPLAIHWPGVVDKVSAAIAAGEPTPPGMDVKTMRPIYRLLRLQARKSLEA